MIRVVNCINSINQSLNCSYVSDHDRDHVAQSFETK